MFDRSIFPRVLLLYVAKSFMAKVRRWYSRIIRLTASMRKSREPRQTGSRAKSTDQITARSNNVRTKLFRHVLLPLVTCFL